jgi:hypothetical protein
MVNYETLMLMLYEVGALLSVQKLLLIKLMLCP